MNNILNMNDAAEMRYFMTGLCDAVVKRLEEEGDTGRGEQVRALFEKELKKEFYYSAYAACFSLEGKRRMYCISGGASAENGPGSVVFAEGFLSG